MVKPDAARMRHRGITINATRLEDSLYTLDLPNYEERVEEWQEALGDKFTMALNEEDQRFIQTMLKAKV